MTRSKGMGRPGTFTVRYGGKAVTLDPSDDWPKFNSDLKKIDEILGEIVQDRAALKAGEK